MNNPIPTWFSTVERRSLLLQIAAAWEGTPFFANSEAPGRDGGVDCVRLLHAVYSAAGVIPRIDIPRQVMDHGQHSDRSLLIEAFETWPALKDRFARMPHCGYEILSGDALCFRAGKVPHHAGVMLVDDDVLHVLAPSGVHRTRLAAVIRGHSLVGRLEAVFRPLP